MVQKFLAKSEVKNLGVGGEKFWMGKNFGRDKLFIAIWGTERKILGPKWL